MQKNVIENGIVTSPVNQIWAPEEIQGGSFYRSYFFRLIDFFNIFSKIWHDNLLVCMIDMHILQKMFWMYKTEHFLYNMCKVETMSFPLLKALKVNLFYHKKANGQASRSAEVRKSTWEFSNSLNLNLNKKCYFRINVVAVSLKGTEAGLAKQIKCSKAFICFLV